MIVALREPCALKLSICKRSNGRTSFANVMSAKKILKEKDARTVQEQSIMKPLCASRINASTTKELHVQPINSDRHQKQKDEGRCTGSAL